MSIESFANQHVLELVAYQPGKPIEETARELGLNPHDIVKLASNENPLGPSPKAVEAIARAAAGVNIYPDGAAFRLRSAIAEFCGVEFGQTVVGTGSSEVIELICHALLNPRAEVVAAKHAFSMYPIMSKLFGAAYVEVPNKEDWTHDLDGFLAAITENTRVVFITNPTNPVGTVVGQQEIDDFMAKVPEHVLVVFDEAYREFSDNPPDTLKFVREGRNVVVLRTFSKAYGLAGLRVGYGIAPNTCQHVAQGTRSSTCTCWRRRRPWPPWRPGRAPHRGEQCRGHAFLRTGFPGHGAGMIPSQGNFILVKVGQGRKVFQDMLASVIVRAGRLRVAGGSASA
ncbi:MAG: pyridoxal phosphate-dependent aminotransferase [Akkermansia sp.]